MRLRDRVVDPATRDTFQPKLWATVVALVLIAAYIVAFVVENDAEVNVHFVLFTAHTSVIWLIMQRVPTTLIVPGDAATTARGPPGEWCVRRPSHLSAWRMVHAWHSCCRISKSGFYAKEQVAQTAKAIRNKGGIQSNVKQSQPENGFR